MARDGSLPADEELELCKEAYTMALYVAICLLAALTAVSEHSTTGQIDAFKIVWGDHHRLGACPLVRVPGPGSARGGGNDPPPDPKAAAAQLGGALAVTVLATIPILVLSRSVEFDVVRLVLAVFIALVGFAVARSSGATVRRSLTTRCRS